MVSSFHRFGVRTGFKPISNMTTTTSTITDQEENDNTTTSTKIMQISHASFELLCNHSKKYHNPPISYDETIEDLFTFYNANHEQKWF
jgi:hypothetical protein